MTPRTAAAAVLLGALAAGCLSACGSGQGSAPVVAMGSSTRALGSTASESKAVAAETPATLASAEVAAAKAAALKAATARAAAAKASSAKPVLAKPLVTRRVTAAAARPRTTVTALRRTRTVAATPKATVSSHVTGCDGTSGWQHRRGTYALRRITYNWRALGYSVNFMAARAGISGMTYPSSRRIEVYVRSCSRMTNAYLAETIAHEIGHALDFTRSTPAWHKAWQQARHIPLTMPWYGRPYANDFSTPAGDFAESFAAWQVPDGPNDSHWGRPTRAQMTVLIPLFKI